MRIVFVTNKSAFPDMERLRNEMIGYHKLLSHRPTKKSCTTPLSAYNQRLGQADAHKDMSIFWENLKFEINETEQ